MKDDIKMICSAALGTLSKSDGSTARWEGCNVLKTSAMLPHLSWAFLYWGAFPGHAQLMHEASWLQQLGTKGVFILDQGSLDPIPWAGSSAYHSTGESFFPATNLTQTEFWPAALVPSPRFHLLPASFKAGSSIHMLHSFIHCIAFSLGVVKCGLEKADKGPLHYTRTSC